MEPLTLQFTPEKRDYVHASRTLAKKSPVFLILVGLFLLGMMGSVLILVFPGWIGAENLVNTARIILIVGGVYALYYLFMIPWQLGRAYQANEHLRLPRTLIFLNDRLRMGIGSQWVDLSWDKLEKAIDGGDTVLLVFKGNEKIYPFIPERAFVDDGTKTALIELIKVKSIPVI